MRRSLTILVTVLGLVSLVACGDDGAAGSGGSAGGGPAWCDAVADPDPTDAQLASVPATHRDAVDLVLFVREFSGRSAGDDSRSDDDRPDAELARAMAGGRDALTLLDEEIVRTCGKDAPARTGVADALRVAEIAGADRSDLYCDALDEAVATESDAIGPTLFAPAAALGSLVPEAHRPVIGQLASGDGAAIQALDREEQIRFITSLVGVGMYADARCGIRLGSGRILVNATLAMGGSFPDLSATTTTAAP